MSRTLSAFSAFWLISTLTLTGCSGESTPAAPSTATAVVGANTTPKPPPSPRKPLSLGSPYTITDPGFADEVTVFGIVQNLARRAAAPPGGAHWVGADVQACLEASRTDFTASWGDWSVSDAKNGQYEASPVRLAKLPRPEFPFADEPLAVGECVRGWVAFPVTNGVPITTVKYKPAARSPVFWSAK